MKPEGRNYTYLYDYRNNLVFFLTDFDIKIENTTTKIQWPHR